MSRFISLRSFCCVTQWHCKLQLAIRNMPSWSLSTQCVTKLELGNETQAATSLLGFPSSSTVDGRLFVQFIALILVSALRKQMRNTGLIEQYTVREMLREMETLTKVNYSGKYGHIMTELTKHQRQILNSLEIPIPGAA